MSYAWNNPSIFQHDPNEIGAVIDDLIEKNKGHVTKEDILHEARDTQSPLHDLFEWNDKKAADLQRRSKCTSIMGNLRRAKNGKASRTRAYIYVQPDEDSPKKAYVPVETALRTTSLRHQMLRQAWRELASFRDRYAGYKELTSVIKVIRAEAEQATEAKEA